MSTDATNSSSSSSTAAQQILTTLGAGSGIDIFKMSRDLTDVEKLPKQEKINDNIAATEAQISAYGLVSYQLGVLKQSFEGLNDANEMATNTSSSTNATAASFSSLDGTAQVGSYDVTVKTLANGQQTKSDEYSSKTAQINGGAAFNIVLSTGVNGVDSTPQTIAVSTATPQGVVNAINAGDYGVTANLVDTGTAGTNYRIILSGTSGAANAFSVATSSINGGATPDLGFSDTGTAAQYVVPFSGSAITGAQSSDTFTFTVGSKTATVQLHGDHDSNASTADQALYTGHDDSALLTAISNALTAAGITEYTASSYSATSPTVNGFKFTATSKGAVTSAPTSTVDGSAVSVTELIAGVTENTMQSASDSEITFNGLTITRATNTINDLVPGAVLSINQVTETSNASNPVRLSIASDTSSLKTKVQTLVSDYNDFNTLMAELQSSSTDEDNEMMGALRRDSATVRYIQSQLRNAILADADNADGSSDPLYSSSTKGLRDIGVSMDKNGNLTFDEDKYDKAVTSNFDNIVTMLTADTTNQSLYSTDNKGLAQNIATVLDGLTDDDGVLMTRNANAETAKEDYADELAALETRYEAVYERYLAQFSAMESMMESMNGTKEYLEGQLESLSKAYDND
tara:strand:- start:1180 stop:3075 length:1896 start_codon:yes stop_codon:yes gene_type:complete